MQPSEEQRRQLVLALHTAVYSFDYSQIKDPGYEPTRRLTHLEYDNTVRDLFGVDARRARKFPSDLAGVSGFDNSANTLYIQPLLMERYIHAADETIALLFPDTPQTDPPLSVLGRVLGSTQPIQDDDQAERAVRRFLLRAYRRPPTDQELTRLKRQFDNARAQGATYTDAFKGLLRTTLVSPKFLMKSEAAPDTLDDFRINAWELANRLSYFLWASMPDEELFELAASGRLLDPRVLHAQVDRMVDDWRSETLGSIFAAQWLGSQHLGTRMRLDPIDNPWCTETLMAAMRSETAMFVHALIREDQPIQRLIDADFTFLNGELAKLYRIPGVRGEEMRRVTLKTDRRGGIFGHGSLLAVTSFPYRTSPVVRGKWILDTVLGTPPPPPPTQRQRVSGRDSGKRSTDN